MRIILTEEEVTEALESYIGEQITFTGNQEVSVDIAADGSAEVLFSANKQGTKAPAKKTPTPRGRKPKAAEKAPEPAPETTPEPEPETTTESEGVKTEGDNTSVGEDQPAETQYEVPAEKPAQKSSTFGSTKPAANDDDGEGDGEETQDQAPAEEPKPASRSSIFSRVS